MMNLRKPFLTDVLKRRRRGNRKTDEEYVCLRVGERAETVIVFLPGRIEQTKGVWFITDPE